MRRGSVLVFSLFVVAMTVLVTGALSGYYVNTARLARFYAHDRSYVRAGATRAVRTSIDQVVAQIQGLAQGAGSDGAAVALNAQGKSLGQILDELKAAVPKTAEIDGEAYELTAELLRVSNSVENNALKISAKPMSSGINVEHPGQPVISATIEFESTSTLNTLSVFDYVYFADNNGQLNSSYVIANGEVGSNGDFDLNGATVNGYLRYLNAFRRSGTPHAWLQGAYMAKIAAEFSVSDSAVQSIEQVRPTNPAIYVEGVQTKSQTWDGGYESVYADNPYSFDDPAPTLVDPPGKEPTSPPDVQMRSTSSTSNPF